MNFLFLSLGVAFLAAGPESEAVVAILADEAPSSDTEGVPGFLPEDDDVNDFFSEQISRVQKATTKVFASYGDADEMLARLSVERGPTEKGEEFSSLLQVATFNFRLLCSALDTLLYDVRKDEVLLARTVSKGRPTKAGMKLKKNRRYIKKVLKLRGRVVSDFYAKMLGFEKKFGAEVEKAVLGKKAGYPSRILSRK